MSVEEAFVVVRTSWTVQFQAGMVSQGPFFPLFFLGPRTSGVESVRGVIFVGVEVVVVASGCGGRGEGGGGVFMVARLWRQRGSCVKLLHIVHGSER